MTKQHLSSKPTPVILRVVDSRLFHTAVIILIVVSAVIVGVETNHEFYFQNYGLLHTAENIIVWLFVVEIFLQAVAEAKRTVAGKKLWYRYFRSPWHILDVLVVAVCLLPLHTEYFSVLRTVRILRLFLLVDQLPRLKLLVAALLKSLPSMGYVTLLLLLHFYAYAILGVELFGTKSDGTMVEHFSSLPTAMLTLFQVVTGDGWSEVMHSVDISSNNHTFVALYFVSFIIIGAMIFLNLFIGIITNEIADLKKEDDTRKLLLKFADNETSPDEALQQLEYDVALLQEKIASVRLVLQAATDRTSDVRND